MITVVCFLWRDKAAKNRDIYTYGPEHVAMLASMVRRHLHQAHEFVCLTDDPWADFGPGVKARAMDNVFRLPGTRFTKLQIFAPAAVEIGARLLCLDLDTVSRRRSIPWSIGPRTWCSGATRISAGASGPAITRRWCS